MNRKNILILVILVILIIGIICFSVIEKFKLEDKVQKTNIIQNKVDTNIELNPEEDFDLSINNELNLERLKLYNLPIIINFGAEWCPSCVEIKDDIIELNEELYGSAIIKLIDIDEKKEIAEKYDIDEIPAQILINSNGKPYEITDNEKYTIESLYTKHIGKLTKDEMLKIIGKE